MSDSRELELALSLAEQAANGIIEEWEELDEDGKEDPNNLAVYTLAINTVHAIEQYRADRLSDSEMMGEVD